MRTDSGAVVSTCPQAKYFLGTGSKDGDKIQHLDMFQLLENTRHHYDERVPVSFIDLHFHRIGGNAINGRRAETRIARIFTKEIQ